MTKRYLKQMVLRVTPIGRAREVDVVGQNAVFTKGMDVKPMRKVKMPQSVDAFSIFSLDLDAGQRLDVITSQC
jgi:hypothetical protein